jgi:benzoate transport
MNFREQIDHNDMSPFQVTAVVVCILAGIIVGFAILILPFTAPAIADSWSLPHDRLGTLLSASLAGMMIGAIVIAPFADRIGRRKTLLFSMTLITLGLLYSGYAGDANTLMIARLLTGLGVGGSAASINTLIAEYCSNKWRDLAIGIFISGGALSGILGGALTAYVVANYDWSAAFVFGAIVSALMTISLVIWLPESVDFLLTRRPDNALQRINKLLKKMRLAAIDTLPDVSNESGENESIWIIFSKPYLLKSVFMWISIFAVFTGFYFITSWTPKLLVDAGWTLQQAIFATVVIKVGGVFSGLGFGYMSQRIGYRQAIRGVLIFTCVFFVLFGLAGDDYSLRFMLPLFLGFFLFGTLITQYALLPRVYETSIRNTGTGWATGIGRFGAMAAPYIAGQMLAAGWDGMDLYFVYAVTYLVSLIAVSVIWMLTQENSA